MNSTLIVSSFFKTSKFTINSGVRIRIMHVFGVSKQRNYIWGDYTEPFFFYAFVESLSETEVVS